MTMNDTKRFKITSGYEMVINPVPEVPFRIQGLLRANGGRMAIVGPYKSEKSLLTQDLALRLTNGQEWLGYPTTISNVLYVNLEISEEKFQERTQDFSMAFEFTPEQMHGFRTITILERNLAMDASVLTIQSILNQCKAEDCKVDVIVLDPRARLVASSENDESNIKHFCDNVDSLLVANPGLSVIIVSHTGKDVNRGPIGHSRFSGWVDTEVRILRSPGMLSDKELEIFGRDIEREKLAVDFSYPRHYLTSIQIEEKKSKVEQAQEFIRSELAISDCLEQELKAKARHQNITDYAFNTALRMLKDKGSIESVHAGGQGNRKLLKLSSDTTHM